MGTFIVTAPDGRRLKITGDTMPTEQELNDIFSQTASSINKSGNINIPEFRKNNLQHNDVSDEQLVKELEKLDINSFSTDIPFYVSPLERAAVNARKTALQKKVEENKSWVFNPKLRPLFAAMQGISNASLNPFGYVAKKAGVNLEPFEAETATERAIERGSNIAFDAAVAANLLRGGIASGTGMSGTIGNVARSIAKAGAGTANSSKLARFAHAVLAQNPATAALTAAGGGALAGAVDSRNPWVDFGMELVGGGLSGGLIPAFQKAEKSLLNVATKQIGKRKLAKQLETGDNFQDINMGNMTGDRLEKINEIRRMNGLDNITNSQVIIPKDRVAHIYDERIKANGWSPKQAAETIYNAIFGKNSQASKSDYDTLTALVNMGEKNADVGFVGKIRDGNTVFVKTGMKKNNGEAFKKFPDIKKVLDGRRSPSSDLAGSTPTFYSSKPYENIISGSEEIVNPLYSRSFIEALVNKDKSRIMKDAVTSGADELAEDARFLKDQLVHRKNGMFDADLERKIKTPEMVKAEKAYGAFMSRNGDSTISPEKVRSFYQQHPVAKDMITEMRDIDPRAFDGITPGSLKEFDLLKRILREDAGNKIGVQGTKRAAIKRAEESLKSLMDDEFSGFKDVNQQYAAAQTAQKLFESKLNSGLSSVGGATVSPFWSGISSPLASAGVIGGFVSPTALVAALAGLAGKKALRISRMNAGRALAQGKTPISTMAVRGIYTGGKEALKAMERQALLRAIENYNEALDKEA